MRARHILSCLILVAVTLVPAVPTSAMPGAHSGAAPARVTRAASEAGTQPRWKQRIDSVVGNLPVSVVIGFGGRDLYRHRSWVARPPASNQKLLLSMALLNRFPATRTITTRVLATRWPSKGVLHGDLWIVGNGDPEVNDRDVRKLAKALAARGISRIAGRVMGATGLFARDWFAPGWRDYFPRDYIALPTALTFRGSTDGHGRHIHDPERRAAAALTARLKAAGIAVKGKPGMGIAPAGQVLLASIRSLPLRSLMHRMDVWSRNFYAEVLGKYLGRRTGGHPGTIAKGARAIDGFARAHGAPSVVARDGSGLSYANRVSAQDMVDLMQVAEAAPWGWTLRAVLAKGGQGTLEGRLADIGLRAKTGTLENVSALSGWVWLKREGAWAQFSILSRGISKSESVRVENDIVRGISANAGSPDV